jgi:hypothetical protein
MNREKRDREPAKESLGRQPGQARRRLASEATADAERTEYVGVLRNTRTGNYIIEPMARHPIGASAIFGAPVIIPAEKFESEITQAILENLAKYHRQVFREELAPKRRSTPEEKAFLKAHLSVSITRYPTGDIWIYPMRRNRGGYAGTGKKIVVLAAQVRDGLVSALREAFSKGS